MKLLKDNKKLILGIIIGIVLSSASVYATNEILFQSSQVSFDNTRANLTKSNGDPVETVEEAIEALETMAQTTLVTYKDEICPGCVYSMHTTTKYNSNSSSANGTNNVLSSSEYTTDYTTLNSDYFLGHVIDGSGYILSSYACGINNGTFFCLRGVDTSQSSLTYKPFYQEGVNVLNKAFPGCNATTSGSDATCSGGVIAGVYSFGTVYVDDADGNCYVGSDGHSDCR